MSAFFIFFAASLGAVDAEPTLKLSSTFQGHEGVIRSVAISPHSQTVVTGCIDQKIRIFDARSGKLKKIIQGHRSNIASVRLSPDGKYLVASNANKGEIKFYDLQNFKVEKILKPRAGQLCLRFSPDRKIFAAAIADNSVALWNLKSGKQITLLRGHEDFFTSCVTSLDFSPDSKYLATAGRDGFVILWDLATKRVKFRLKSAPKYRKHAVAFSKHGLFITGAEADEIIFWNPATGKEEKRFDLRRNATLGRVYDLAFSPDGEYLAVVGSSLDIYLCHVKSGRIYTTTKAHLGPINCLAFSPDGRYLVTGSDDRTAKLWQITWPKGVKSEK